MADSPAYIIYKNNFGLETSVYFDVVHSINHIGESQASEFPLEDGAPMTDHVINLPSNLTFTVSVSDSPMRQNPGASDFGNSFSNPVIQYPIFFPNPKIYPPLEYPPAPALDFARVGNQLNLAGGISAVASAVGLGPNITPQPTNRTGPLFVPTPGPTPFPTGNFISTKNRVQDMFNTLELIRTSNFLCEIVTNAKTYNNMVLLSISSPVTAEVGNSIEFSITARQIRVVKLGMADVPVPAELIAAFKQASGSKNAKTNVASAAQNEQTAAATKSPNPATQALKMQAGQKQKQLLNG